MSLTIAVPDEGADPVALYVHWPFCLRKCPYCDFNSHVRDNTDHARWRRALMTELESEAERIGPRPLASIFFGGGTPSLMEPETVAAVIKAALRLFPASGDETGLEVTLEANPSSVEAGRFAAFRAAGVNRLSLGVQALNDAALSFLGRVHDVKAALAALEIAASAFPRFSFDLIYARPGQTVPEWSDELRKGLSFGAGHMSLYQLTIEPGTAFHEQYHRRAFALPDEETGARLYERTQEIMAAAGLPAYEISNHARPGHESRHNLVYWTGGDYLGIGPGAHGRIGYRATARLKRPENWLEAVEARGEGLETEEILDPAARAAEAIMMGLRLRDGVEKTQFRRRFGHDVEAFLDLEACSDLAAAGFLANDAGRLAATEEGLRLLNALLSRLLR